jgi:predicted transcriptional regulator
VVILPVVSTDTPTAEVITFKLPADEKARLEAIAAADERTVSAVLRLLVRQLLEERTT